ncbi:MAG: hypothetical protein MJZ12_10385 [Prevotella sp.]|nr:hypothetical protein [Prevotella sp.]
MKKNLHLLAVAFLAISLLNSCNSLNLVLDKTDDKGARTMCTSDLSLFGEFDVAMGAKIEKKDTVLAILVTCSKDSNHGVFDKTDHLRLRLSDGNEITLQNLYDREYDRETSTNNVLEPRFDHRVAYTYSPWTGNVYVTPYTVEHLVNHVYTTTTTKSFALYPISKQQVKDVMEKGVIKLRVEIENADYDMPHPEKVKDKFAKLYTYLHNAAATPFVRSEF